MHKCIMLASTDVTTAIVEITKKKRKLCGLCKIYIVNKRIYSWIKQIVFSKQCARKKNNTTILNTNTHHWSTDFIYRIFYYYYDKVNPKKMYTQINGDIYF